MAQAHQLIPDLLAFRLQLHGIGEWLPATAATEAEMLAEGLEPVRGRGNCTDGIALHVILLLFEDLYVHHVSRNGEFHKEHHPVDVGDGLSFGRHPFDEDILQDKGFLFLRHLVL